MASGQRPFDYDRQPFPFIIPENTGNTSGAMNPFPEYGEPYFIYAHHLGQAWFANLAQLRSLPDGHPDQNVYPAIDRNCRGIIHVPSGQIDHPQLIAPHIFEPDPSGNAWLSMTARDDTGDVLLQNVSAHIQVDTYGHYISWLRSMMNNIFAAQSLDYDNKSMGEMRYDYLLAYFPRSSGLYFDPNATEFLDISLAEVQYNPYPRIAGDPPFPYVGDYYWTRYAGQWGGDVSADDEDYRFVINGYLYYDNLLSTSDYGINYNIYRNYFSRYSWRGSPARSSPLDDDDYIALSRELLTKFGTIDVFGPVFPCCQSFDGSLTSPHSGDDSKYEEPPSQWFVDGAAMGKEPGQYTIEQSDTIYNKFSDVIYPLEADMDDFDDFMAFYYWNYPYLSAGWVYGGSPRNVSLAEHASLHALNDAEPLLYGYIPGDMLIGYMAWCSQDNANSIRIDGEGLIPNLTRMRICDLSSRDYDKWVSTSGLVYHATGDYIVQSGSREVHNSVDARNVNVSSHWGRNPATKNGFPSYSGEPVRYILDEDFTAVQTSGYVPSIKDRRAWFPMPDCNNPSAASGEQELIFIEPIFAERRNVKKILVQNDTSYSSRGVCNAAAPSGFLSVWPSNPLFQNGSGVGYHVMDKGIWMRKHPASCGMTLVSPYNGQELLFKRAEDKIQTWGTQNDTWRIEVRPGNDFHYPEYYNTAVNAWRKNMFFRDPYAIKEEVTPQETHAQVPQLALPHNTYLREFTGERSYVASWYRNKEEQVAHTDGTYTIFNLAAQVSSFDDYKISREDYLEPDNYNFWWHDEVDPTNPPDLPVMSDWGSTRIYYPIDSGYWHKTRGGNAIPPSFVPQGGVGLDQTPDIYLLHPHAKYSPLRSQSSLIGTFTAGRTSTINDDFYGLEGDDAGKNSLTCDVDVYIANKPYLQFDIPGLTIQRSGEATIDMSHSMLEGILKEGTLKPGFSITQRREWVLRTTTYRWFDGEEINNEEVVDVYQHQVAFDGFLIMRLEMYGLQESSKGGIVEGWGRLYETASAGVTETINPDKDWPNMSTDYVRPENPGETQEEDRVKYSLYHVDYWSSSQYGWGSVPRYRPYQADHIGQDQYDSMNGSRFFRVWFDPNDDSIVIHCEDDLHDLKRYGLLLGNSLYRYDVVNRESGGIANVLHSTREDEDFLPGMNPGDLPGWDPYVPGPPGAATRRAMNQDYQDAKKCVMSFTWVEDELVAAVEMYDQQYGSTIVNHGRKCEIATLDPDTGIFDNERANMIFAMPGRMFTKQRPLLEDRAVTTPGTAFVELPIWDYIDPYQYEHYRYGGWLNAFAGYGDIVIEDDPDYGVTPFSIFVYSSEVSDMWPKIVYTNIS